jgi:hypothetical protein
VKTVALILSGQETRVRRERGHFLPKGAIGFVHNKFKLVGAAGTEDCKGEPLPLITSDLLFWDSVCLSATYELQLTEPRTPG